MHLNNFTTLSSSITTTENKHANSCKDMLNLLGYLKVSTPVGSSAAYCALRYGYIGNSCMRLAGTAGTAGRAGEALFRRQCYKLQILIHMEYFSVHVSSSEMRLF